MIETERLILRKWRFDDAPYMFQYASDPEVGPRCGWKPHESIDTSKEIISNFINFHPYCYAVCLKENINHPIGCIELMEKEDSSVKELGFWLGKPYWGNGYIKEASSALIEYGFNELDATLIYCGYYEGNHNSKRVQEKLGFEFDHKEMNHYIHQLDKTVISIVNVMTRDRWNQLKGYHHE